MLCDPDESDVGTDGGLIPDAGTAQDTWCHYPEGGKRFDWLLGVMGGSSKLTPFSPLCSTLLNLPLRGVQPSLLF